MKKSIVVFIIAIFLFSCESNWGNYNGYKFDHDSGIEYYIVLDKGQNIYFSDSKVERAKKGTLVKFHSNSGKVDSIYLSNGSRVIRSFVLKDNIAFDSSFILVDQKPLDSIFGLKMDPYPHWEIDPTKEKINKSNFHQYWIIKKQTDDIYGPLTKEEYLEKRKELMIPTSLQINLSSKP